ncbi:hypothetical protein EVAR_33723_1 [Eumeta japonica]|uniref:Histone-lysine N-methyltransferase SETMAR n=1 Tax=Eumeta variegata TaxID=151549 RepID=A0A4C1VTS2_EUMVA|nr:hypothetical protein EVAR_33723_1 [Eumeta japonica]
MSAHALVVRPIGGEGPTEGQRSERRRIYICGQGRTLDNKVEKYRWFRSFCNFTNCPPASVDISKRVVEISQKIELAGHPPYSPDLVPNDFYLLPDVKNKVCGQRFSGREEVVVAFKGGRPRLQTADTPDDHNERVRVTPNVPNDET